MQDGTGFDVLDGINYEYYSVVFITAFQEYALTAFKFNAIDFLLKPVDPKDLMTTVQSLEVSLKNKLYTTNPQLESLKTSIKTKTSDYNFIAIPSTKKIDFIKIDDILSIQEVKVLQAVAYIPTYALTQLVELKHFYSHHDPGW